MADTTSKPTETSLQVTVDLNGTLATELGLTMYLVGIEETIPIGKWNLQY
jgi:hypothetical protein